MSRENEINFRMIAELCTNYDKCFVNKLLKN